MRRNAGARFRETRERRMAGTMAAGLDGRIAVVTGGTQGLGESVARLFAARGAGGIVICGRDAERGAAVAESITASGCRTLFV